MHERTRNRKAAHKWPAAVALLACLLLAVGGCAAGGGGSRPEWLDQFVARLESEAVTNPPASIYRYEYGGRVVYFRPQWCCDMASELFDEDGKIICHPDGGLTGKGDGLCPDFLQERQKETLVWKDKRSGP